MQRRAIEFDVALDLQMLTRINQRPRRRGKAHAAHIEVRDARPIVVEDVVKPRQPALPGNRIALADKLIDLLIGQAVNLQHYDALGLSLQRKNHNQQQQG